MTRKFDLVMYDKLVNTGNEWITATSLIALRYILFAGIVFLIFYVGFKRAFLFRKIQERFPKKADYVRDISFSLVTTGIFGIYFILIFLVFKDDVKLFSGFDHMPWWYHIISFGLMVIVHDTYFYWTHRLMHHPKLFRYFHLVHHKSHNPSPWAAYAFHPFEAIVEGGIIPLLAFLIPAYIPVFLLFFLFQLGVNVYGHTGFELFPKKFNTSWIGRWINTSVAHNMHHKHFNCNYSLYFMFWDRLMGTVHQKYDKVYHEVTRKK